RKGRPRRSGKSRTYPFTQDARASLTSPSPASSLPRSRSENASGMPPSTSGSTTIASLAGSAAFVSPGSSARTFIELEIQAIARIPTTEDATRRSEAKRSARGFVEIMGVSRSGQRSTGHGSPRTIASSREREGRWRHARSRQSVPSVRIDAPPFEGQEPQLEREPTGEAREPAILSDHAVARNDDRKGVSADRLADG